MILLALRHHPPHVCICFSADGACTADRSGIQAAVRRRSREGLKTISDIGAQLPYGCADAGWTVLSVGLQHCFVKECLLKLDGRVRGCA